MGDDGDLRCSCGEWVYVGHEVSCLCEVVVSLRVRIAELEAREPPSYPLPMCTIHHDMLIGGKCVHCQSKGIAALVDRVSALERCKNRLKRAVVRMDNGWRSRYRGASRALANVIRENTEKANRIAELEAQIDARRE